jgi:hypothetical protein
MPATPRVTTDRSPRNRALFTLEAQRLLSAGHYRDAAEICKRGLIYFPENHTGYIILAHAFHMLGEEDRAINVISDGFRRTGSERLKKLYEMLVGESEVGSRKSEVGEVAIEGLGVEEPPVQEPPVQEPPAQEPPAQEPPAQEPPVQEPPVREPAVEEPPVEEPPAEKPPVQEPPVQEPPVQEPPVQELASEEPVAIEELPPATQDVAETAVEEAGANDEAAAPESVVEESIASEPVAAEPVADEAVAIDQVADEPTIAESPAAEAIADEPPLEEITPRDEEERPEEESWSWEPEESFFISVENEHREEIPQAASAEEPIVAEKPVEIDDVIVAVEVIAPEEPSAPATPEAPIPERTEATTTGPKMLGVRTAFSSGGARSEQSDRTRPLALALHAGKSISRLRSSNLRLIPGLEFAPLRHEDNLRRQSIAPLINEPMPQPEVRSRAVKNAIEETSLPPLPSLGDSPGTEGSPPRMRIAAEPPAPVEEIVQQHDSPSRPIGSRPAQPRPASSRPASIVLTPTAETQKPAELTPLEELARRLENARIPVVEEPEQRTAFEPSIVSDTLANILVAQGAIAEALKAFQTLARIKPERFEYYQGRIQEMKWRLQNPDRAWPPGE